jgi:hypothetical protein
MKVTHPKIGSCKVLIEAEVANKYFTLIESYNVPKYDSYHQTKPYDFGFPFSSKSRKLKRQYYVLWGNTPDFATMGITQLLTDKLNTVTDKTIVRRFFEIINASENMTFLK